MIFFLSILIIINIAFSDSVLSDRYTTLSEIEEKINQWDLEFSQNTDPYTISGEGIIFHHEIIGYSTVDNFPIWALKFSFNANIDEDEPKVLILGQCHAEEIYGVEIAMELAENLLYPQNPGSFFTTVNEIYGIMANSEVWIIPTHNPEGLNVVHGWYNDLNEFQQDESYRKNKRDNNENGIFDFIYV